MKRILGYILIAIIITGGVLLLAWHFQDIREREHLEHRANTAVVLPPIVEIVEVEKIVEKSVITRIYNERIVEVFVHHEPGLREFDNRRGFINYLTWYRTEKMVNYGVDQCEDYAYDFFQQAIADGYVVSTEIVEQLYGDWHMANTVPIGNKVWLVEVSIGTVELYALKD